MSQWYKVSNNPRRSDVSDHPSDDGPYNEPLSDQEENPGETIIERSDWCPCGECQTVINAGILLFCCCDTNKVQEMKGEKHRRTLIDDFNELILNKKVQHLVSYSSSKKGCIDEK